MTSVPEFPTAMVAPVWLPAPPIPRFKLRGRSFLGLNEYTVYVKLPAEQTLTAGEYWFNITPACTNGATDGSCYVGRLFLSNTTQNTNAVVGAAQPAESLYLNSAYFGITWTNWCDSSLGFNIYQCRAASYGLTGTAKND